MRLASELDVAVQALLFALEKDGLKVEGRWRTRGLYADIHGLARPGNLVPSTVAPGELQALMGRRVAVVGIAEVGVGPDCSTQARPAEVRPAEVGAVEAGVREVCGGKLGGFEVGVGGFQLGATGDVGIGNPFLGGGGPRGIQLAAKFTF